MPKVEQFKANCLKEFREGCEAARLSPIWSYLREERIFAGDMEEIIKPIRVAANAARQAKRAEVKQTEEPVQEEETPNTSSPAVEEQPRMEEVPTKAEPAAPAPRLESMAMVIPTLREISKLSFKVGRILVKNMFKNPFRLR